jgi:hypothetical protein
MALFRLRKTYRKVAAYEIKKRQKFILMSFVLTVILITTQTVPESLRFQTIAFLALFTLFLSVFSLWGELSGVKYFLLLLLPVYFVVGASLFYFLLPVRWLTRLPFAALFGVSVYLLMLTSNIYNVAAIRTIALLRAAHGVGLLFSLLSAFFLSNVLYSLHLPFYLIALGIIALTFPLYLVGLWSYELVDFVSRKVTLFALIFTLVTTEVGIIISFWPIVPINAALMVSTMMYGLLGLGQLHFGAKLKRKAVYEHIGISLIVFTIIVISTRWGG